MHCTDRRTTHHAGAEVMHLVMPSNDVMGQVHHAYGRIVIEVLWETQQHMIRAQLLSAVKLSVDHTFKCVPIKCIEACCV